MPKRYRLLKDHPYAAKGTIVNDAGRTGKELSVVDPAYPFRLIWVPILVESDWLEEVKEEIKFTKEQADAFKMRLRSAYGPLYYSIAITELVEWLDAHISPVNEE